MEEFIEQSCTAAEANATDDNPDNDGMGGWVMNTRAENVAGFLFALGEDFYDEAGTGFDFTKPEFVEIAKFWQELMAGGCAFTTESYPNPEFATRKALIVNSSTAGLPYQESAFEAEDAFTDDVWGLIPFPGTDSQAIDAYAQNSAIVMSTTERELATWLFMKWLTSPEINAKWTEASAYFPIRISAVDFLDDYVAANERWGQGLALVSLGVAEPGSAVWQTVRREVGTTFAAIIQGTEDDIMPLLEELNAIAAEAIEELE
jgi:multiple sugar transport system substrate-binding protein/sn-glycerol 3-phosphate transport system substrate-binding protein